MVDAFSIKVEVFGDKQTTRAIVRVADRSNNLRPVFERIADDFLEVETRQFDTEGGYASGGWKPLKPDTILAKARAGQDTRILHATLAMRNSLTKRGAPGQVRRITKGTVALGTRVKSKKGFVYPSVHQRGNEKTPQRSPIEFTANDRRRWADWITEFVTQGAVAK